MQTVFTIGKHKVAACLDWQVLPGLENTTPAKELKARAIEQRQRFGVLYEAPAARYPLAGFPHEAGEQLLGHVPAAVWLAESVDRPTLYIEALDDTNTRYWVLYIRSGIDPRTDRILTDDDTVKLVDDLLAEEEGAIDFIVGGAGMYPSSHMIERAVRRTAQFQDLLLPDPPAQRVKQLVGISATTKRIIIAAVLSALVLGGAFAAIKYWRIAQSAAARAAQEEAERARQAAIEAQVAALTKQAVVDAIAADTATPPPTSVIRACTALAQGYPALLGGWRLSEVTCLPAGGATATYQRDVQMAGALATQDTLYRAAQEHGLAAHAELMADTATVTGASVALTPRPALKPDQIPTLQSYSRHLSSQLQALSGTLPGFTASVEPPKPRPITYATPDAPAVQIPVATERGYDVGQVRMEGTGVWALLALPLAEAPLTITQIRFRTSGGSVNWTVQAQFVSRNG